MRILGFVLLFFFVLFLCFCKVPTNAQQTTPVFYKPSFPTVTPPKQIQIPEIPKRAVLKKKEIAPIAFQTVNEQAKIVIDFYQRTPDTEWKYYRFLTWHDVPTEELIDFKNYMLWWMNQLSFVRQTGNITEINPRLWLIDLREFGWNEFSWEVVAERDPYMRMELFDYDTAIKLIDYAGYQQKPELIKQGIFPVISIMYAPWLFRETMESDRSTSYYDLLYSKFRFNKSISGGKFVVDEVWRTENKKIYHPGGRYVYPDDTKRIVENLNPGWYDGEFKYLVKQKQIIVKERKVVIEDIPKNEDDWNKIYGIDKAVQYYSDLKLDLKNGAIVAGARDFPGKGSFVAQRNRVVQVINGFIGPTMKTFDTDTTSGDTDYLEKSPEIALGKIKFKAGELLAYLPNGGLAGLLVNGQGQRVEKAPLDFAHNRMDEDYADVRTMMGCVVCHAPDGGFIPPKNMIEQIKDKVYFNNREKEIQFKSFFTEWEERIPLIQVPNKQQTIKLTQKEPALLPATFIHLRRWYDAPLNIEKAALNIGCDVELLKFQLSKSKSARLSILLTGGEIPRDAWEKDRYIESVRLIHARKLIPKEVKQK